MAREQDDPPSTDAAASGPVVTAVVTAVTTVVVGWASFFFGTQGLLPVAAAVAVALAIGAVIGGLAGVAATTWLRRPRREPEPEPVEPEEEPDPHDVDLVELVREIVAEQEPRFTEAGTVLQAMVSGRIRVDAGRRRVTGDVMRVLDESFEATKRLDPGEVLIGVARKTVAGEPVARVTVTDNRVGATTMLTLPLMPSAETETVPVS